MAVIRKLETPPEEVVVHVEKLLRSKHRGGDHDDSNWLISYADMMTLLCVFYIMLFSMSKVNTPEFEKVKKQVAEHFGTKYQSPTEDLGKFMTNVIQEAGVQKDTSISSDGTSVSIVFHSTLFFGSLSAEISKDGEAILNKIISSLGEKEKQNGKHYKIVIEGHTDSQPVVGGPFPSNWELSSARATRVVRMFLDKGYLAPNLLAIGYSDTQPVAPSRNPDGTWNEANLAKNRRVVLRVLLPEVDSIPWSGKAEAKEAAKPVEKPAPAANPATPNPAAASTSTNAPANAPTNAATNPPAKVIAPVVVQGGVKSIQPVVVQGGVKNVEPAAPDAAAKTVAPASTNPQGSIAAPAKPDAAPASDPAKH